MSPPQLKILRAYAKMDDASIAAKLPPTVYFSHTRHTLTIFDAFPKALFHFLVLPRLLRPVAASASTSATTASPGPATDHEEEGGGGEEEEGRDEQLTLSPPVNNSEADLTSLRTLLGRAAAGSAPDTSTSTSTSTPGHGRTRACPRAEAEATLRVLADEAERLRREIEREMHARYGFAWTIWTGFHAVPSMEHLHLHVISSDLIAPALKTKRHYHSFSPSSGFFVPLAEVCAWFDEDGGDQRLLARKARLTPEEYEPRLKDALVCFRCGETAKNMPALKKHLQDEFDTLRKRELGKLKRKRETEVVSGSPDGSRPMEKTARVSGAQAQVEKGDTGNP